MRECTAPNLGLSRIRQECDKETFLEQTLIDFTDFHLKFAIDIKEAMDKEILKSL